MQGTLDTKHGLYRIDHYSRWAPASGYLSWTVKAPGAQDGL